MNDPLTLTEIPASNNQMIIRRPVAEVFEAFVNPVITTQFWFSKGSSRLVAGATVRWDWEMYNVGADVLVKTLEPAQRIVIEWESYGGNTTVEWQFQAVLDGMTHVTINERGFHGDGDTIVKSALSSTEGFNLVLAGAKAWLEHGIRLNLVSDHSVEGIEATA